MIASKEWGELIGVEATGRFYILASYRYAADELSKDGHCLEIRLCALALNWKTITQRCKDAMAQRTKVSVCISLEFSVVP